MGKASHDHCGTKKPAATVIKRQAIPSSVACIMQVTLLTKQHNRADSNESDARRQACSTLALKRLW